MQVRTLALTLIALNLVVYLQVADFDFIHLDDDLYITENEIVQQGITWRGLQYAFSAEPAPMSNPLALVAHMLDVELFGLDAGAHHLSNLFLHAVNTLLLLFVLMRATMQREAAFVVAALFAIHPLHVESVAWISDRKDLLSALFWLATIWAYLEFVETRAARWMAATSALYALSLLAKPMAVTLPFVLLLLDLWPLKRADAIARLPRLALEKAPLFALAALACAATWYLQNEGGAVHDLERLSFTRRVAHAVLAYGIYLRQTLWPADLGIFYPFPKGGPSVASIAAAAAALATGTLIAVLSIRRRPWIFVGWFWFTGMLVPVIGVVQVGSQLHADRYTYQPLIGLFIAAVYTVAELITRESKAKPSPALVYGLIFAVIGSLAAASRAQTARWQNSETLFTHTLEVCGPSLLIHNNLGHYYITQGRLRDAAPHFYAADQRSPGNLRSGYNLAYIAYQHGDFARAIELGAALYPKHPEDFDLCLLLADAYRQAGDPAEALKFAERAYALKPGSRDAARTLGLSLEASGNAARALEILQAAAETYTDHARTQTDFANFLARQNRLEDAFRYYHRAVAADPGDATIYYNYGAASERAGAREQAIEAYEKALEHDPGLEIARQRLDVLRSTQNPQPRSR